MTPSDRTRTVEGACLEVSGLASFDEVLRRAACWPADAFGEAERRYFNWLSLLPRRL